MPKTAVAAVFAALILTGVAPTVQAMPVAPHHTRDRGPPQRYPGRPVAALLARPVGPPPLPDLLAGPLGPRPLQLTP